MLPKLNIDVPQEGYSFDGTDAILRAKVSSGPSRLRLDMLDAPIEADVSLMLSGGQYQYWRAFFRHEIQYGALPFLIDLMIETPAITERQVQIVPGTLRTSVIGDAHSVQFRLEVANLVPANTEFDAALLLLFGIYGESAFYVLNQFDELANDVLPTTA